MTLYPLKFRPRFVEKMWGGRKLQTVLGKPIPGGKAIGESWELFDFPPGVIDGSEGWVSSEVANGPLAGRTLHEIVGEFGADLYGDVPLCGEHGQFPILIKFLDACEDLSVQVHPDRAFASANPHAHLKSEAWYIVQSDPGSRLLNGLVTGTTRQQFASAIRRGDVERLIRSMSVREGDCYYLPSGTVHALGAGILAAEVQTPSDTTFRVFDFNRIDPTTGKPRALHVEEALACIDFDSANSSDMTPDSPDSPLVTCPYFHIERRQVAAGQMAKLDQGIVSVLIFVRGIAHLATEGVESKMNAVPGDVVLLPACLRNPVAQVTSDCTWLRVTFPTAK